MEFGAWSLELGAWRLEFGWSLPCYGGGSVGRVHGRAGDPGSRSGRQPQRPEDVDHVRHKDVVFTTVPRDFCLSDRLVIDNRTEVLIT